MPPLARLVRARVLVAVLAALVCCVLGTASAQDLGGGVAAGVSTLGYTLEAFNVQMPSGVAQEEPGNLFESAFGYKIRQVPEWFLSPSAEQGYYCSSIHFHPALTVCTGARQVVPLEARRRSHIP